MALRVILRRIGQGNLTMADDKHYVGGQWYRICDRTGFKVRDVATKKQWNNILVRDQSWEPRQPQDFVQGVKDDQTVSDPRPRSINVFQGPLTTVLTAACPITTQILPVQTTIRWAIGDIINIMMNNGVMMVTSIADVPSTISLRISPGLAWSAPFNAVVVNTSVVSPADLSYGDQP